MFGFGGLRAKTRNMPGYDGLIYAIGDVHGRLDQLRNILTLIDADRDGTPAELILLGDYIDRGPHSHKVLDLLVSGAELTDIQLTCLRGNHEQTLLTFLDDVSIGPEWGKHGGRETLAAYGVAPPRHRTKLDEWERCRAELSERIPSSHVDFLNGLPVYADRDPYFFVHAGIDPDVGLEAQKPETMMWIRTPFLNFNGKLERFVVHGHSASKKPTRKRCRLGIDTGAYITGTMTAVRIDHKGGRLLQS